MEYSTVDLDYVTDELSDDFLEGLKKGILTSIEDTNSALKYTAMSMDFEMFCLRVGEADMMLESDFYDLEGEYLKSRNTFKHLQKRLRILQHKLIVIDEIMTNKKEKN